MASNQTPDKLVEYLIEKAKELNLIYSLSTGLNETHISYIRNRLEEVEGIESFILLLADRDKTSTNIHPQNLDDSNGLSSS